MKKLTIFVVGTLIVGGIIGFTRSGDKVVQIAVETEMVSSQRVVQTVNATGKIEPQTQVKLSADVSAKITRLYVEEGQWVEAGTLLFELDRESIQARVEQAEASVRSAEANAKLVAANKYKAERDLARSKELVQRKLESQSTLDSLDAAYRVEVARHEAALDQIEQARAALKQAKDNLSKTTIYAPMSGTITDLRKEIGEIAIGSQFQEDVVMIVADLSVMEARVNVDENDIVSVSVNDKSEIEVDALLGEKLTGHVTEIANSANEQPQGGNNQKIEFEVAIRIDNPHQALRPGMTASADIVTEVKESTLAVPLQSVTVRPIKELLGENEEDVASAAFQPDADGLVELVFIIDGEKAVARQVKTGIQSDTHIEVVSGLKAGDLVVSGSYKAISKDLGNGSTVKVENNAQHKG